jgi:hypothetical protein
MELKQATHCIMVLYGRFKLQTSFIGSRISFTRMHFYETCPSLRCTHDIQFTHTVGQIHKKNDVHVKDVEVWYLLIMIHVYVNHVIGT